MIADKRPRCPKCGEPARAAIVRAGLVRCLVEDDGTLGHIIYAIPPRCERDTTLSYECGGGHVWEKE